MNGSAPQPTDNAPIAPVSLEAIAVIIPARDEAATIAAVIQTLQSQGLENIWVVDNGSRDRTAEVATQAGATVVTEPRPGYGQACWQGLQQLPESIPWVLFCDADGSDDLAALPTFLKQGEQADLILGDRRATAEGQCSLTPVQNFGNGLATTLIRWGWGQTYHDLGPLRLIRRAALEKLQMRDRGFGWTVEMQVRAVEEGLRIVELPVSYRPRQGGQSKISGTIRGTLQAGITILTTLAWLAVQRWRRQWSLNPADTDMAPPLPRGAGGITTTNPANAESTFDAPDIPTENPVREGFKPSRTALVILSAIFVLLGCAFALPFGDFRVAGTVYRFWVGMGLVGVGWLLSWR
ncbi:MAG: glycosyltransferase family 2 protein, partial [Spirulinaceae cyanobacterium]